MPFNNKMSGHPHCVAVISELINLRFHDNQTVELRDDLTAQGLVTNQTIRDNTYGTKF